MKTLQKTALAIAFITLLASCEPNTVKWRESCQVFQ